MHLGGCEGSGWEGYIWSKQTDDGSTAKVIRTNNTDDKEKGVQGGIRE